MVTWCELKAVESLPKRAATRVLPVGKGLNQDQMNWHMDWRRHGGRSLILIGVGSDIIYTLSGAYGDCLNEMNAEELASRSFADSWRKLAAALTDRGGI
jgi:hypothetical protein